MVWFRRVVCGVASIALLLIVPGTAAAVNAEVTAQTTVVSTDPRFFSQTGYRIDNDAFWNFFQQCGQERTFGYPVSRSFLLDGFQVQIFQRRLCSSSQMGVSRR